MKAELSFPSRSIWLVGVITAFAVGAPLSFLAHTAPWLICIPILLGTGVVSFLEISRSAKQPGVQLPLLTLPKHFWGLRYFRGHVGLSIPVDEDKPGQEVFSFLKRRKQCKSAMICKDESGERVYVIDSERFMALLLSQVLPTMDKATELSLLHALHRYGETNSISADLREFLADKTVAEVIKSDFRGNAVQTLNRAGETVIRDLVKRSIESKQLQLEAKSQ